MFVLGTAGHVDHGKSTLLEHLTGQKPDRLPEEKKRGMTIDLNFVWLDTARGKVGIVDVPGHERFVKNMVVGVGCVDAFLFVVAADDGWMPQSEEHLTVLQLLGVQYGALVVTKTDLVSPERVEEVKQAAVDRIQSRLGHGVSVLSFSSKHPEGIRGVRQALNDLVTRWTAPEASSGARVWVDRVFNPKGKGTVVTGTLREGGLEVGDTLWHWPGGQSVTVRGLEAYHETVPRVEPVTRAAVQLGQVALSDLSRGHLLSVQAPLLTRQLDARVTFLQGAPKRNQRMKFFVGTLEVEALCIPFGKGGEVVARFKFEHAIPVRAGERFLLRLTGEERTVGGGVILDSLARSRSHALALERVESLEVSPAALVRLEAEIEGVVAAEFTHHTIYPPSLIGAVLAGPEYRKLATGGFVAQASAQALGARLQKSLAEPKSLKSIESLFRAQFPLKLVRAVLAEGVVAGAWELTRKGYVLQSRAAAEHPLADKVFAAIQAADKPLPLAEFAKIPGAKEAVFDLVKRKRITQLPDYHYMDAAKYQLYCDRVKAFLVQKGEATTIDLKPVLDNPSRKVSVLILEQMDADRITYLKEGVRRLLKT